MRHNSVSHSDFFTIPDNYFVKRTEHAIIHICGDDATQYLQGQLTNDISQPPESIPMLAAHCNFKGKMWAIYEILTVEDGYYLVTDQTAVENTLRELKKFAVFSKVSIEQQTDMALYCGYGTDIEQTIKQHFDAVPSPEKPQQNSGEKVVWLSSTTQMLNIIAPTDVTELAQLASGTESIANALDILAGYPKVTSNTSEAYIPQMLNLQAINGISFNKGCYTGQEVVARTKFLGKNKRAMYLLHGEGDSSPVSGAELELSLGENWRRIGGVVSAVTINNNVLLLAVLPNDSDEQQSFRLTEQPELALSIIPLPYSLT